MVLRFIGIFQACKAAAVRVRFLLCLHLERVQPELFLAKLSIAGPISVL